MITIQLTILFALAAIAGFESGYIVTSYIDVFLTDRKITRARVESLIRVLKSNSARSCPNGRQNHLNSCESLELRYGTNVAYRLITLDNLFQCFDYPLGYGPSPLVTVSVL